MSQEPRPSRSAALVFEQPVSEWLRNAGRGGRPVQERAARMWWWVGLIGGSLAGFLGRWGWAFELCAHFRVQYAVGLGVLSLIALCHRWWRRAAMAGGMALINLWLIVPLYAAPPFWPASGTTVRVLFANVHRFNPWPGPLLRLIQRERPDVIVLAEVTPSWLKHLSVLSSEYPVSKFDIHGNNFGIGLMSRAPMEELRIVLPNVTGLPAVLGRMRVGEQRVTIIGAHPMPPTMPRWAHQRDGDVRALADLAAHSAGPVIMIGDFNTTSWSPIFGDIVRISGLRDSRQGFGVQTTWPAPFRWMGLSIDHALVSPGVTVRRREVGPWIGSDHFPIVIDVDLGPAG